jgi:hypothetical protein
MMEIFTSIFGKILGSIAIPVWNKVSELFTRPKIKLKKAPKNIFEYIKPTASKDRVKEILGSPHYVFLKEMEQSLLSWVCKDWKINTILMSRCLINL